MSYLVVPERRLIDSRFIGRVTDEMLLAWLRALLADPGYSVEFAHLIDGGGITELETTTAGVRTMVGLLPKRTPETGARVIVAPSAALYGMARMYQLMSDASPPLAQIVATRADAEALLGISM